MYTVISILILIASILLVLIVLVQNSKGGGLAANFSSSNQIMGVRKTTDFLEKSTWTLAGAIFVLCILAAATIPRHEVDPNKSAIEEQVENAADPTTANQFPTTVPQQKEQQPTSKEEK
ncbi:MAG: preprotein translocase subunit SecG [Bacteroidetes bacterium]|nr:preprotein translocase subunit SecG [Bacteroidota bacterium]